MEILKSLNKKQQEAVQKTEGPLLILAGPGSGKTKTLTHRIAYLVGKGVPASRILAVTFTNKAAGEMRERVLALLTQTATEEKRVEIPLVGTFHAVCVRMLHENAARMGYSPRFSIYDRTDQTSLMKQAMKDLSIDTKSTSPGKILSIISGAKDLLLTPELFAEEATTPIQKTAARLYEHYQRALVEANAFDFDDLIMQVVLLLREHPDVLARYQRRFRYVLVDEYQDTNEAQYALVTMLAASSRNICVVGDDAQAIYSWRNANVENILSFERDWPDATIVRLEQNYRSTKTIVSAASQLIQKNESGYTKELWTDNPDGEPLTIKEVPNEYEEAAFVLNEVERMVRKRSYALRDFVVLYRTNAQSRAIEEVFLRAGVPYKIVGGIKFYERAEVKDVLAWLRLLHNEQDLPARERLERLKGSTLSHNLVAPTRKKSEIVEMLLQAIRHRYTEKITLTELLKFVTEHTNFEKVVRDGTDKGEERWQNVQELQSVTEEYSDKPLNEALEKFLEDVSLMQEADNIEERSDLVHFMTLHMAKGLEFPVVFIAGCEEGILPHTNSMDSQKEFEEERRLLYVGITRAQHECYLLFARRRMLWGSIGANPPSSFLFELPQELINFIPLREDDLTKDDDILQWD